MIFPVVLYGCESWTMKKAECCTIDAFELWCWRRLLRVPWTARRPKQSILKETSARCSLERLMLKLKLEYFGHLMQRADSDAGKDWRQKEKMAAEDEMVRSHHWLSRCEIGQTLGDSEGQGSLAYFSLERVGHDFPTEQWQQHCIWKMIQDVLVLKVPIMMNHVRTWETTSSYQMFSLINMGKDFCHSASWAVVCWWSLWVCGGQRSSYY